MNSSGTRLGLLLWKPDVADMPAARPVRRMLSSLLNALVMFAACEFGPGKRRGKLRVMYRCWVVEVSLRKDILQFV
jgi:hypothetical protein